MNITSQNAYAGSSGMGATGAKALTSTQGPVTLALGSVSGPSVEIAPDGRVTMTVDPATWDSLHTTAEDLDLPLVGVPVEIDGASLARLVEAERADPAGAPLAAALDAAMDAAVAQFRQDYPALYAQALSEFNQLGMDRPMSLFDLLNLLQEKGVGCTISLLQVGAKTKAISLAAMIKFKVENAEKQFKLAATTASEGAQRVGFTAASGVASAALGGAGLRSGVKAADLRSTAQPAGEALQNTAAVVPRAAPAPAAAGGQPAGDAFAPVAHNQAAARVSPAHIEAAKHDSFVQTSYGLSTGTSGALNAGATKAEVDTSVAGAQTQGETAENEADIAAAEALKSGAEQNIQSADQSASSIISGIAQTVASLAATTKEVSG